MKFGIEKQKSFSYLWVALQSSAPSAWRAPPSSSSPPPGLSWPAPPPAVSTRSPQSTSLQDSRRWIIHGLQGYDARGRCGRWWLGVEGWGGGRWGWEQTQTLVVGDQLLHLFHQLRHLSVVLGVFLGVVKGVVPRRWWMVGKKGRDKRAKAKQVH